MKKQFVTILAALLAILMLAGCGSKDVSGTVTPAAPAKTEAPAPAATEAPAETEAPEETEAPASLGRIEGGTYTNTYAGYACDLDTSWTYYSAEELQALPDNIRELMADTEIGETMDDYPQITDMQAENADLLASMNVLYTKLPLAERVAYKVLGEEGTIDATLDQKDSIIEAYSQMEMEVQSMEKVQVRFLGEDHYAMRTEAVLGEIPVYMVQVVDYTRGQYGITLTISTFMEDHTGDVLDLFYAVD